jgi:hypothetical protein
MLTRKKSSILSGILPLVQDAHSDHTLQTVTLNLFQGPFLNLVRCVNWGIAVPSTGVTKSWTS